MGENWLLCTNHPSRWKGTACEHQTAKNDHYNNKKFFKKQECLKKKEWLAASKIYQSLLRLKYLQSMLSWQYDSLGRKKKRKSFCAEKHGLMLDLFSISPPVSMSLKAAVSPLVLALSEAVYAKFVNPHVAKRNTLSCNLELLLIFLVLWKKTKYN